MSTKVSKSEAEWRAQLTPEQFRVARQCATEQAFTGTYWNHKGRGVYTCVCCGEELFSSEAKFDSGSGWPSFSRAIDDGRIVTRMDYSFGMERVEVCCGQCDAHLGHLFSDGPKPTGKRYCVNSASLRFRGR